MSETRYGAAPDDWAWFSGVLGLTADLLPVVSDPTAKISRASGMRQLGKVPSRYNAQHEAVGFSGWTSYQATPADVAKWGRDANLGICLQSRRVRALDVDVTDPGPAARIHNFITNQVGILPCRMRSNASKFLLAFELVTPGKQYGKRAFKTAGGIVEFLAAGQQFIVAGTHPSGVRYEWQGGLPDDIPALTETQFEELWTALYKEFATSDSAEAKPTERKEVLHEAVSCDPIAASLSTLGVVLGSERDGRLRIVCPFAAGHTDGASDGSSTVYFPAHTGGYERGHFDCKHASCSERTDADFLEALGLAEDPADDFDVVEVASEFQRPMEGCAPRFAFVPAAEFALGKPPSWLIKGLLPDADLIVVFGESGSGKSFFALDAAICIASGAPWRGKPVRQGRVAYICAEGAGGFRNRLNAFASYHGTTVGDLHILGDAPNFLKTSDVSALVEALGAIAPVSLVIVDTLSQVLPGANENSGEDMGKALTHARHIKRVLGCPVLFIHHSGKDSSKGARGWSGLRAAADAEIEIIRNDKHRTALVTKLKDGEDGAEYGFELKGVAVGQDEDGDVTSCVVVPTERSLARIEKASEPKGAKQRLVLHVLDDLLGLGDGAAAVEEVIDACVAQIPHDPQRRDQRRMHVLRAINALQETGKITSDGGRLSLAGGEGV